MKMLQTLLDVLAPNRCLICAHEGALICDWCLPDALEEIPSRCAFCQRVTNSYQVCIRCRSITPLRQVWVTTVYKDMAKALVRHMKFRPDRSACSVIADELDNTLPYFDQSTVITFVPTARTRVRQRGFDHAALITRELAYKRGLQFEPLLLRLGSSRQVGSEKKQRVSQIKDSYTSVKGRSMPQNILIIDDVMTTGATLSEAARALKKASVRHVNAAVFAQTI